MVLGYSGVASSALWTGSVAGFVVVEAGGSVKALAGVEAVGVVGDPFARLRAGSGGGAEVVLVDVAHVWGHGTCVWRVVSELRGRKTIAAGEFALRVPQDERDQGQGR